MIQQLTGTDEAAGRCCLIGLQLRDQRLLSRESAPPQPRDHSLSASLSESVIRLISNCLQVEECLLSLLSPAISAYSAARSVPVSRLRNTCQPVDQHKEHWDKNELITLSNLSLQDH